MIKGAGWMGSSVIDWSEHPELEKEHKSVSDQVVKATYKGTAQEKSDAKARAEAHNRLIMELGASEGHTLAIPANFVSL